MKRSQIIESLVKEGFQEKTLVNFSDKQIVTLYERFIGEAGAVVMPPNTNPSVVKKYTDQGFNVKLSTTESKKMVGNQKNLDKNKNGKLDKEDFLLLRKQKNKKAHVAEEKPSAGLTKKEKSEVVKKAKKGEDIGKKGKGFAKVEKAAKKGGAKNPKAVAAAAMWKNIKKKKVNEDVNEWLDKLTERNYHPAVSKGEILNLISEKLNLSKSEMPDFMKYDSIKSKQVDEGGTKVAPVKTPTKSPSKPARKTPMRPSPGKQSKPKAVNKVAEEKKSNG